MNVKNKFIESMDFYIYILGFHLLSQPFIKNNCYFFKIIFTHELINLKVFFKKQTQKDWGY